MEARDRERGTAPPLEPIASEPLMVYISRDVTTRDLSDLPLRRRYIYPLLDVHSMYQEHLQSRARGKEVQALERELRTLNIELRLRAGSREPYTSDVTRERHLITRRDALLTSLSRAGREEAKERLAEIGRTMRLYEQLPEPTAVTRMYRVEEGEGYTAYMQEYEGGGARVMVVLPAFNDAIAASVVESYMS